MTHNAGGKIRNAILLLGVVLTTCLAVGIFIIVLHTSVDNRYNPDKNNGACPSGSCMQGFEFQDTCDYKPLCEGTKCDSVCLAGGHGKCDGHGNCLGQCKGNCPYNVSAVPPELDVILGTDVEAMCDPFFGVSHYFWLPMITPPFFPCSSENAGLVQDFCGAALRGESAQCMKIDPICIEGELIVCHGTYECANWKPHPEIAEWDDDDGPPMLARALKGQDGLHWRKIVKQFKDREESIEQFLQ